MAQAEELNHWKFDQQENGNIKDLKGNLPAVVDRYVPVQGHAGTALKFSQADGARVVTLSGTDVPPPWTFGVWVRREKNTEGCSFLSSNSGAIKLEQWPNRNVLGITRFGVKDWTIDVGLPLNVWTYLTVVAQPDETKFYMDGKEVGTVPASIDLPRGWIGSTGGYTEFLEASIEELQLHKGVVAVGTLYEPPQLVVTSGGQAVAAGSNTDLGTTQLHVAVTRKLVLTNAGKGVLDITNIQLDDSTGQLAITPTAGSLTAGQSLELTITEKATAAGPVAGKITIHSNDPGQKALVILLSGNVEAAPKEVPQTPGLVLKQYYSYSRIYEVPINNGDVTTFSEHRARDQFSSIAYYIENSGTGPLRVEGVTISNPTMFIPTIDVGTPNGTRPHYPIDVPPKGRHVLFVVYHPQGHPRPHTTQISLRTNDPAHAQTTWTVNVA